MPRSSGSNLDRRPDASAARRVYVTRAMTKSMVRAALYRKLRLQLTWDIEIWSVDVVSRRHPAFDTASIPRPPDLSGPGLVPPWEENESELVQHVEVGDRERGFDQLQREISSELRTISAFHTTLGAGTDDKRKSADSHSRSSRRNLDQQLQRFYQTGHPSAPLRHSSPAIRQTLAVPLRLQHRAEADLGLPYHSACSDIPWPR